MTKCSTQIDTIKFVYNEMSVSESKEFLKKLDTNENDYTFFNDLVGLMTELDQLKLEPSDKCLTNILDYSKNKKKVKF